MRQEESMMELTGAAMAELLTTPIGLQNVAEATNPGV